MPASAPQPSATDLGSKIADRLAQDIISGRFAPESLLPKEVDLVRDFGVSRPTLRTGLQVLESLGMITRVSGYGTIVRPFADWALLSPLVSRWLSEFAPRHPPFLADIFSFRLTCEPVIAMAAARCARGRDLQLMEEAYAGMAEHVFDRVDGDVGNTAFDDHDLAFHQSIYRATQNLIWTQMAPILEPAIRLVIHRSNTKAAELRDSLGRHEALLIAIRRQDEAGAFNAALAVLERTAIDIGVPLKRVQAGDFRIVTAGEPNT